MDTQTSSRHPFWNCFWTTGTAAARNVDDVAVVERTSFWIANDGTYPYSISTQKEMYIFSVETRFAAIPGHRGVDRVVCTPT